MSNSERERLRGQAAVIWGLGGVVALLVYAVMRLAARFVEALEYPFAWPHWLLLVVNTGFMAYAEGYRGFHKSFAPRVVARALTLPQTPSLSRRLLAPLFCMGYFHTTRRRLIGIYGLTAGIVALVISFRYLPQPWRGILDFGVVVGLSGGITSLLYFIWRARAGGGLEASPEIPDC